MVLVGLMGIKESGKSSGATYLVEKFQFIEKSFAEPLKKTCGELFMLSDEQMFGSQAQKETPDPRWFDCTPRKMFQFVGTDLLRDNMEKIMPGIGKNIFTHRFKMWYEEEMKKNPNLRVVVSDVRFQNEIDFIQSLGGVVIKINRPSVLTNDMHPSEMELQSITTFDRLINNTGSLHDFYSEIEKYIFQKFGLKPLPDKWAGAQYFGDHNDALTGMTRHLQRSQ